MSTRAHTLRERYFRLRAAPASEHEAERAQLWEELSRFEHPASTSLAGLELCAYPSARFRELRFVEAKQLAPELHSVFARPSPSLPGLLAVFVDPHELGFHSFENIVCLDALLADLGRRPLRFREFRARGEGVWSLRGKPTRELAARVAGLDALELYLPPPNAGSRGGRRFIFHAAELAAVLSKALSWALPKEMRAGFVGVNPVFRCNRFEPDDAPFVAHRDQPYADPARGHYSTHTLLLYLQGGAGEDLLSFESEGEGEGGEAGARLSFARIEAWEAFLFDQRLVHAGRPFAAGAKIFLRSELIFAREDLAHDPAVGAAFAKAIYLSAEQLFAPQLAAEAHAAYERAAAAHWQLAEAHAPRGAEPLFLKRFEGQAFITNGYDYWFASSSMADTQAAAALALVDVLNAKVEGAPFRGLCASEQLEAPSAGPPASSWLLARLRAHEPSEPALVRLDPQTWLPEAEEIDEDMGFPTSPDFDAAPFPDDWDATRNKRVVPAYAAARAYTRTRLFSAPLTIFGRQLFLLPEHIVVEDGQIHVMSADRAAPVHFAGAVFYSAWDFIEIDFATDSLQPLVPPILSREQDGLLHLRFDLFRNDWMVSARSETVRVPKIETREIGPDYTPWLDAEGREHPGGSRGLRKLLEREQ